MPQPADEVSENSYSAAGVDIDAGADSLNRIKSLAASTHGPQVLEGLGGFGGLFAFPQDKYEEPVLVASADGVGTKLKIAFMLDKHDTVGQDLVNHCVNDILATGGKPLFFLDYYAAGKLDGDVFQQVISGMAKACRENGCALLGGETAEMPGFYTVGEYDLSGTIVGVAEKSQLTSGGRASKGDLLVGLSSSGLHTNGYSLARKVLLDKWDATTVLPELGKSVGDALLEIHRSYLPIVEPMLGKPWLTGMGHITGGGLEGNLSRLLAEGQSLVINWESWEWLPIFKLIQEVGNVPNDEMRRAFNLGIGWVFVVSPDGLGELETHLASTDESFAVIGEIG